MYNIELTVPSDPKVLKVVRCTISHLCDFCGFEKESKNAIILAVDEAVSNVIRHTYEGKKDKRIEISCRILQDRFEVVLRDFGKKLDLDKIKSRALEDVRPGGLGVYLIKSTMDVVIYDNSAENGNQLTLAKYLPGKKERK